MAEAGGNGSPVPAPAKPAKPKKGRLVSNEQPLEDFHRLVEGEGDVFRKAIQDLGAVVKENVEGSFSRSAFPLAIECLKAMRETALVYEEVETYNAWVSLRSSGVVLHSWFENGRSCAQVSRRTRNIHQSTQVQAQGLLEWWVTIGNEIWFSDVEKAGKEVGPISDEEAKAALDDYEDWAWRRGDDDMM
jgi:hypothetical protein